MDFRPIVTVKIPIDSKTIVPEGVISKAYDSMIPPTTEKIANAIEIRMVFLNPFPYMIAVTLGITNRAEINKIPTS